MGMTDPVRVKQAAASANDFSHQYLVTGTATPATSYAGANLSSTLSNMTIR